jgi:HEAT repeat protein
MNHRIKIFSAIAILFSQHLSSVYSEETRLAQPAPTESSQQNALQAIASTNGETRLNAAIQLDEERNRLIQGLLSVLKSTNSDTIKIEAIIVLGEYRAAEAVPLLVEHLEWDDAAHGGVFVKGPLAKEATERKLVPVVFALTKIGMPAIPAILDKISISDDNKIVKKCVACCCVIEGIDMTRKRLEDRINKEAKSENKMRLESAIQALNNIKVAEDGSIIAGWF